MEDTTNENRAVVLPRSCSASRIEELEEPVTGAAILLELFEGYMGPQWFELMHDAELSYPDKIKAEAEAIFQRRHAKANASGQTPRTTSHE